MNLKSLNPFISTTSGSFSKRWSFFFLLILSCSTALFAPDAPLPVSAHNPGEHANGRLTVLSWNIAMLPVVDMVKTVKDRADRIGMALAESSYDIILFQEAFTGHARRAIYRRLKKQFPFQYGPANARTALRINSGLWVLSRIPLQLLAEHQFRAAGGLDRISRKGAMLLQGEVNNQPFHLIGTHLDSNEIDPAVRFAQLIEINEQLIQPRCSKEIPLIICGDFNTDRKQTEQYQSMLDILACEDGHLLGDEQITFGFLGGTESGEVREKPRQLDYILTKGNNLMNAISRRISVITESVENSSRYLSDHHGIEATISFLPASR